MNVRGFHSLFSLFFSFFFFVIVLTRLPRAVKLWTCYPTVPQQSWVFTGNGDNHLALYGGTNCVSFNGGGCGLGGCAPGTVAVRSAFPLPILDMLVLTMTCGRYSVVHRSTKYGPSPRPTRLRPRLQPKRHQPVHRLLLRRALNYIGRGRRDSSVLG